MNNCFWRIWPGIRIDPITDYSPKVTEPYYLRLGWWWEIDGGDGGRVQPSAAMGAESQHMWVTHGGLEEVTGLMELAEEHSRFGWLLAPYRAHRAPQSINLHSQCEPTNRMKVHTGPTPNTNTGGNTSASQRTLKLYKLYKGEAMWLAGMCVYN